MRAQRVTLPTDGWSWHIFHLGKSRMYVNRGPGVIPPPVRFRVRPEISVFTLAVG